MKNIWFYTGRHRYMIGMLSKPLFTCMKYRKSREWIRSPSDVKLSSWMYVPSLFVLGLSGIQKLLILKLDFLIQTCFSSLLELDRYRYLRL